MSSTKDLKKRIQSVKNTQQTTQAMKMVSAAKLRKAQDAMRNQKPYSLQILKTTRSLLKSVEEKFTHPLLKPAMRKKDTAIQDGPIVEGGALKKKVLLLVVTSDRGLCGGFNSGVIRSAQKWLQEQCISDIDTNLAFIGRKGYEFFKIKKQKIFEYYAHLGGKVSYQKSKELAQALIQVYLSGEVDEVKIVYNEFKSGISQVPVIEHFIPFVFQEKDSFSAGVCEEAEIEKKDWIVKPSATEVLNRLFEKSFSNQSFRILLESQAGEQGARMAAMENATKNAGEMIKDLTLQYNKERQASITKELLEIIAGSESQKN